MSKHARRIAIVTDSTCDIPSNLVEKHQIVVVPLYILWGDEELRDGVDVENTTFYERLSSDSGHPKTSQPTPADFAHAIHAYASDESGVREAIIFTVSGQLSGTFGSACAAREMVDLPVHVVDSLSASMGLGWQVIAAARIRDQGGSVEEIIEGTRRVRQGLALHFTVGTLEYLHRGGRIGGAAKLIGTALQLKPLLTLNSATGLVDASERVRTRQRALRRAVEATLERLDTQRPMHLSVVHGAAPDQAKAVFEEVKSRYNPLELTFGEITPALGVHLGPGLVGFGGYND